MKSLRLMLAVVLVALSTAALAQSDAQKSFDKLKTVSGSWDGPVTVDPPMRDMTAEKSPKADKIDMIHVSMRITSRGNALVHEMQESGTPEDPTKYDHPVTMFYLDGDRLYLTHYCDAGNRPRMVAKASPDGKTLEFDFVDVTGNLQYGHMQHAVFTILDANHHTEDWTFLMPGDKVMHAHMDLKRVN